MTVKDLDGANVALTHLLHVVTLHPQYAPLGSILALKLQMVTGETSLADT